MKNQIISKFQRFEFLNQKGSKGNYSFFKTFGNLVIFIRIKIYSSKCRTHVKEIIMQKNTFGYSSKLILTCSNFFHVTNYQCTIMYVCEKSPSPHEYLIYILDYLIFSLKFVPCKCMIFIKGNPTWCNHHGVFGRTYYK